MNFIIEAVCLIVIALVIYIFFVKYKQKTDKQWWKEWEANKYNFPFQYKGRTLWYSRSCAVAGFIFAKNREGEWCVLANQRGKGTPDYQFHWNAVCGYVDWNEKSRDAIKREIQEETSVNLDCKYLQFYSVSDDPRKSNQQNITVRYFAKIEDKTTEDAALLPRITNEGEKDEVNAIEWIPISKLDEFKWAFNHRQVIEEIFNCRIKD